MSEESWARIGSRFLLVAALQQLLVGLGMLLVVWGAGSLIPLFEAHSLKLPLPTEVLIHARLFLPAASLALAAILLGLRAWRAWIIGLWLTLLYQLLFAFFLASIATSAFLPLMMLMNQS